MNIYLDIETLPGASDALMESLRADAEQEKEGVRAPSNYKDEAKIAEYIAAKHVEIDAVIEEKRRKTSLDGMYGTIACICYAIDDSEIFSISSLNGEKKMLNEFYSRLVDECIIAYQGGSAETGATFVGHNIVAFDLPFLKHRSIICNVNIPSIIYNAMYAKPWDKRIADTMLMWSPDRDKRVSMDKLCKALGIPGKDGFDGSMVADTWHTDPQKVIDYCKADVKRTRAIYKRLTFSVT